jgi:hypothetical protein
MTRDTDPGEYLVIEKYRLQSHGEVPEYKLRAFAKATFIGP